jgi:hypothetical protein
MKTYYYSPATGEIINTDAPADWMGSTTLAPPVFDAITQGAFFRSGAWVIEQPNIAELLTVCKSNAIARVREMRRPVFYTLGGIQAQANTNVDAATAKSISVIQDSLKTLPDIDLSKCKTEADINSAFATAWDAIVASAPVNVVGAFNDVAA